MRRYINSANKILIVNSSSGNLIRNSLRNLNTLNSIYMLRTEKNLNFTNFLKKKKIKYKFLNSKSNEKLSNDILNYALKVKCDYIVLVFNKIIVGKILKVYKRRIFNLHPSYSLKFKGLHADKMLRKSNYKYIGSCFHEVISKIDQGKIIRKFKILKQTKNLKKIIIDKNHEFFLKFIEDLMFANMKFNYKRHFLICGGYACGTSNLSETLSRNSKIKLLKRDDGREYNFFKTDRFYRKGVGWYQKQFFKNPDKLTIDHSSQILTSSKAIKRLYKFNPDARIIIILRDRIERSWADYRYSILNGFEKYSFYKSLLIEKVRYKNETFHFKQEKPFSYFERSNYLKYLKILFRYFPKKNVLILNSEDLRKKQNKNLLKVFKFMNLKMHEIKKASIFSSFYIKNIKFQHDIRNHFKNKNINPIIEKIRSNKKINYNQYTAKQVLMIKKIKNNIIKKIPEIPSDAYIWLKEKFKKDSKILKKITGYNL